MSFTVGSLFDGSGGFPLAAVLCGGTPVYASEVEPYPIAVTKTRFPYMKHLGSVTDIKGNEVEPVDVITFGSPCQDLSVAGKRAGLKHTENGDDETTRSGLFLEAVRIIKEMREATGGKYPRFALWENVPGAFSSNKGEDFRVVCEELIKVVEPTAVMPAVPQKGWNYADCYCGDGWSLAYRVLDSQYWGVPQRRRRIYLILDLGGERAREVLFERQGVRGYFETGRTPWKGTAGDAENCIGAADRAGEPCTVEPGIAAREGGHIYEGVSGTLRANAGDNQMAVAYAEYLVLDDQGGSQINVRTDGKAPTLRAEMHGNVPCVLEAAAFKAGQGAKARSIGWENEKSPTLASEAGGNSVPAVVYKCFDARGNGDGDVVSTITGDHERRVTDYTNIVCCIDGDKMHTLTAKDAGQHAAAYSIGNGQLNQISMSEVCNTLDCMHDKQAIVYGTFQNTGQGWWNETPVGATVRTPCGGDSTLANVCVEKHPLRYIVRRLTPTECARLQGFADRWGIPDSKDDFTDEEYRFWLEVRNTHARINGKAVKDYTKQQMLNWYNKLHTDSAEYKMWGNGIALPTALYVMQGIADVMKGETKND